MNMLESLRHELMGEIFRLDQDSEFVVPMREYHVIVASPHQNMHRMIVDEITNVFEYLSETITQRDTWGVMGTDLRVTICPLSSNWIRGYAAHSILIPDEIWVAEHRHKLLRDFRQENSYRTALFGHGTITY